FDPVNDQTYYIEVYNKGKGPVDYNLSANDQWIKLSMDKGKIELEDRIMVSIDWNKISEKDLIGTIIVKGAGNEVEVKVPIRKNTPEPKGFIENNGIVSIGAANYSNAIPSGKVNWQIINNLGRTGSAVIAQPVNIERQASNRKSARLEYEFTLFEPGEVIVEIHLSPTLNFMKSEGLVFGISIDDEEPQLVNMHEGDTIPDWKYPYWWNTAVSERIMKEESMHIIEEAGNHTLKIWMVDPGIVFQKIVIDRGGLKPSYLGPPESKYIELRILVRNIL
ncbi:glycosyl hydrolase, partial [Bacteroidota bacterium]